MHRRKTLLFVGSILTLMPAAAPAEVAAVAAFPSGRTLNGVLMHARQQAVITGVVADSATGEPLRGAAVRIQETERSTVTDADGRYTFEDVAPGTYTLVATMIGYSARQQRVTVTARATATVDFSLAISAVPSTRWS